MASQAHILINKMDLFAHATVSQLRHLIVIMRYRTFPKQF